MGISTDIDTGNIGIETGDTLVIDGQGSIVGSNNRYAVSAMAIHNPTAGTIVVDLFRTADNTSLNGTRVAQYELLADASADALEIIGQGYIAGTSIVAVADVVGTNIDSTVTIYEDL
jgi:hypothetical protein